MAKKSKKKRPPTPQSADQRAAREAAKAQRRDKAAAEAQRTAAELRRTSRFDWIRGRGQWLAIGAVVVALIGWAFVRSLPESGDTSAGGWDLPAVANDPDGDGRLTLAEFSGKPIVVNFYANWCEACHAELPDFARVSADLADQVHFVGINTQDKDDPFAMPELHGVDWWALGDDINGNRNGGSGLYDNVAQTSGMPITAFYDANGTFLGSTSILSESTLRQNIAERFGITGSV